MRIILSLLKGLGFQRIELINKNIINYVGEPVGDNITQPVAHWLRTFAGEVYYFSLFTKTVLRQNNLLSMSSLLLLI